MKKRVSGVSETEKKRKTDVKNSKPVENGCGKSVLSLFQTEENRLF
jgi:hypothetical protein